MRTGWGIPASRTVRPEAPSVATCLALLRIDTAAAEGGVPVRHSLPPVERRGGQGLSSSTQWSQAQQGELRNRFSGNASGTRRTDGRRPGRREERTSKALEEPGKKEKRKSSLAEEEQATESTTSFFSSIFAVAAACAAAAAAIVKQVLHAYSRGKKGRKVGRGPGSPSLSSPPTKSRTRDSAPAAGAREEKPFRRHHFGGGKGNWLSPSLVARVGSVGRSFGKGAPDTKHCYTRLPRRPPLPPQLQKSVTRTP